MMGVQGQEGPPALSPMPLVVRGAFGPVLRAGPQRTGSRTALARTAGRRPVANSGSEFT